MIEIKHKYMCSGCHSCVSACPKKCMKMTIDEDGFSYPSIDKKKCIECGICVKKCPHISPVDTRNELPKTLAVHNKDLSVRLKSSSGGVFSLLAEYVLGKKGVVFGAGFDENFAVKHMAIENKKDLQKLRVSKYVQSIIGDTFKEAKKLLEEGRVVLFTGTPCQIFGLTAFLGKDYENLFTHDLFCHGVPSPMVWEKYVKYREDVAGSKTKEVYFRKKEENKKASFYFKFENGTEYIKNPLYKDVMMKAFFFNKCLRPSCHKCAFKKIHRPADLTLGDFWGIEIAAPEMKDRKGVSIVLTNTEKGEKLFDAIKDKVVWKETDLKKSLKKQPMSRRSAMRGPDAKRFMKDIKTKPADKVFVKYSKKIF